MRSINQIVIHCSASPNGVAVSMAQIDAWHRDRGFTRGPIRSPALRPELKSIGYHWVIGADGVARAGRDKAEVGVHPLNHGDSTLAICMVGTDSFFKAQWQGLNELLGLIAWNWSCDARPAVQVPPYPYSAATTLSQFAKLGVTIIGHRELSLHSACPGFSVPGWLAAGMQPTSQQVLDNHPAIASSSANVRLNAGAL